MAYFLLKNEPGKRIDWTLFLRLDHIPFKKLIKRLRHKKGQLLQSYSVRFHSRLEICGVMDRPTARIKSKTDKKSEKFTLKAFIGSEQISRKFEERWFRWTLKHRRLKPKGRKRAWERIRRVSFFKQKILGKYLKEIVSLWSLFISCFGIQGFMKKSCREIGLLRILRKIVG